MSKIIIYDPNDANVPNRVTQVIDSANTPEYTEDRLIDPDLSSVSGIDKKYWKVDSGSVVEMLSTEKDSLYLTEVKQKRIVEIDAKTEELITTQGFDYDGEHFDLELIDQINYIGLHATRNDLTYPYEIPNATYTAMVSFAGNGAVHSFYLTAMGIVTTKRQVGWELKEQIVACTTVADVDAIVDNR